MTLLLVAVLGVASTVASAAISLAATTALINGASGLPKPAEKPGYIPGVANNLLAPNTDCQPGVCLLFPVNGPETIFPFIGGLSGETFDVSVAAGLANLNREYEAVRAADPNGKIVIFGYSQSGDIVTKQLRRIAADPNRPASEQLEILIVGNTNRPNGGLLSRLTPLYIPFFNASFDGPTPTHTGYQGTDIAFNYDGIGDFPLYPLNVLATVNALFGFLTIHPTYPAPNPALGEYTQAEFQAAMADPANRQSFGDTTFISLPIKNLPILHLPRAVAAKAGVYNLVEPFLDLIEPTLTVLIELGYDRTIPYGQFTTAKLFPIIDPVKLAVDLLGAAGQGVQEAVQDVTSPTPPPEELVKANLVPPIPGLLYDPFSGTFDSPEAGTSSVSGPPASSPVSIAPMAGGAPATSSALASNSVDAVAGGAGPAVDSAPANNLRSGGGASGTAAVGGADQQSALKDSPPSTTPPRRPRASATSQGAGGTVSNSPDNSSPGGGAAGGGSAGSGGSNGAGGVG